MGTESGPATGSVDRLDALLGRAREHHFHQLVEALVAIRGEPGDGVRPDWLKLRSSDLLSFPASDVRRARALDNGGIEIQAAFSGFYGVDAPLPQYFLEDVTYQDEAGKRVQAFLDVFNNQAYWLLHLGWRKHRLLQEPGQANLFGRLASALTGTYQRRERMPISIPGALANQCRSATGIETVLRETLNLPALRVDDKVISWIEVDQPLALTGGQALGQDTLLGQRVPALGRKVAIHTGLVSLEQEHALRPEGEQGRFLDALLREYLPTGVAFDVHMTLSLDDCPPMQLGSEETCLGRPLAIRSSSGGIDAAPVGGDPAETGQGPRSATERTSTTSSAGTDWRHRLTYSSQRYRQAA